ncbi:hypothetical protein CDIK_1157 [Cucumispora dikerogammari]|nr:hypothetical protein CDIK_1157 [Cucumispora dikerogammari]
MNSKYYYRLYIICCIAKYIPVGPVVRISVFHTGGSGSIPGQGTFFLSFSFYKIEAKNVKNFMLIIHSGDLHNLIDLIHLFSLKLIQYFILREINKQPSNFLLNNIYILLIISFKFDLKKHFVSLLILALCKDFYMKFTTYDLPFKFFKRFFFLISFLHVFRQQKYKIFLTLKIKKQKKFTIEDLYFLFNNKETLIKQERKNVFRVSWLLTFVFCLRRDINILVFFYVFLLNSYFLL